MISFVELKKYKVSVVLVLFFIIGIWFVVIRPMGPSFSMVPGDLGDARFNVYILEHFYQWFVGQIDDYWDAPIFFPFQESIAFSDNLLGSAPIYVVFRVLGFDNLSAFQAWYIFGFCLNYLSAICVLLRMDFKPVAIGVGAFLFTFGLPVLGQEGHAQLVYRFCVPLVCYFLWYFIEESRLELLIIFVFFLVWQFFLSIYLGVFLFFLLIVLLFLIPFSVPASTAWERLTLFPNRIILAWSKASFIKKIISMLSIILLVIGIIVLFEPYLKASKSYGFGRDFTTITSMLPRLQSYFIADNSRILGFLVGNVSSIPMRHEHQLFSGLAVIVLILAGILGNYKEKNESKAFIYLISTIILIVITLYFNDSSFYYLIWWLPGINSIRAVTRIILVLLWPLSFFVAWVVHCLSIIQNHNRRWIRLAIFLLIVLMISESVFFTHTLFNKEEAQTRIENLRKKIPATLPEDPILYVAWNKE